MSWHFNDTYNDTLIMTVRTLYNDQLIFYIWDNPIFIYTPKKSQHNIYFPMWKVITQELFTIQILNLQEYYNLTGLAGFGHVWKKHVLASCKNTSWMWQKCPKLFKVAKTFKNNNFLKHKLIYNYISPILILSSCH